MIFKKIALFLTLIACLYGTSRFCHKQTQGFKLSKIRANFPLSPIVQEEKETKEEIRLLLKQNFSYLGRGLQSFVFLSEDGKYVLKIFNNQYQRRLNWLNFPLFPSFLKNWQHLRLEYNRRKLDNTFRSYQIAYEELKDETGLLYLHLMPSTGELGQIQITDRLNIAHPIDLDNTAFLLQKKADLVYDRISFLMAADERQKAESALRNLVELLVMRYQKGIADNDPLIRTNFGYIDEQAVQIDVGPFSKDEKMKNPAVYWKEIERITASLKSWIEGHYPELLDPLEQSLTQIKNRET